MEEKDLAVKKKEEKDLLGIDRERLRKLIKENESAIAKINGTWEITRPIAIALYNEISSIILKMKASYYEDFVLLEKTDESVSGKFVLEIRFPEGNIIRIVEVGEASAEEFKDSKRGASLVRIAYTRAMKRALERLVGEDFINKTIEELKGGFGEKGITEKQKEYINKLIVEKGVDREKFVSYLKKNFGKESIEELSFKEAQSVITLLSKK